MSLKYMRVLLGNSVRVGIDVSEHGLCAVRARWKCGCAAHGTSFAGLRPTLCEKHRVVEGNAL